MTTEIQTRYETAAFIMRVSMGVMFLAHGLLKILVFTLAGTAGFFEALGLPGWLAYAVTYAEVIGGVMLILGLYVRQVAIATLPILLGSIWAHAGNGWLFSAPNGGWEYSLFLSVAAVVVILLGPGRFSLTTSRI